jgi:putative PIN family toxin of toxin-antitoxin system
VLRALRDTAFGVILSEAILLEVLDVLSRKQLVEKYDLRTEEPLALDDLLLLRGQAVTPVRRIQACRDPLDDMFLEAAIAGQADVLVSGDADLLALSPFEGLPLLSPAAFLG